MAYLRNVAIAADKRLNALIGGDREETLSSHAWRNRDHRYWGWTYKAINMLFFWQRDHCYEAYVAYVAEQKRWQLPREFQSLEK